MSNPVGVSLAAEWYQALDFAERCAASLPSPRTPEGEQHLKAAAKLDRWRRHPVFRKDEASLRERLRMDQMNESTLLALLGESPQDLEARCPELPSSLIRGAELIEAAESGEGAMHDLITGAADTIFSGACLRVAEPLVAEALGRLRNGLLDVFDVIDPVLRPSTALGIWFKTLAPHIELPLMRTLALEVNLARISGSLPAETPAARFAEFIDNLCRPECRRKFFREYPVLARHLHQVLDNWVAYGLDFFTHLTCDFAEIRRKLWSGVDPGELTEIEAGAGDLHRAGRSVLRLTFSSGSKLIYKPRSLVLDGHFKELLTWVNAKREGGTPAFCTMNIVDGGDHGWCEFIAPRSCGTVAEVERFYWRQGGYLAILYALEASDFHSENLIARGEDPMLVDLEALFHPRTLEFEKLSAQDPTRTAWLNSVCRVGLLPQRENGTEEHEGHDVSGLGDRPGNCRCDSHG